MKQILDFLKVGKISVCFIDKQTEGLLRADDSIEINNDLWLVETFLHEYYHYKHPNFSESRVTNLAIGKRERMTKKQIISLAKKIRNKTL